MPRVVDASPPAKAHINALSKIGYDFNTAVSDIIDNSIAAKSKNIEVEFFLDHEEPFLLIMDDGFGMDEDALISNMSIGCKDPDLERNPGDLGRFGAGMKTASFSQADILTVISKTSDSEFSAAVWDKKVVERDGWKLQVLDYDEYEQMIPISFRDRKAGTIVKWNKISCIQSQFNLPDKQLQIDEICDSLHSHIGLYFHRFLTGPDSISIKINNRNVESIDPFMRNIDGSEELARTSLRGGSSGKDKISIIAYRLPFLKNMTESQIDLYGGEASIKQNQGLYIYREKRLIIAGGWLGMRQKMALSGLARIQIDIPSSLDNEWSTDVKKSLLQIPFGIKNKIKRLLTKPVKGSAAAYNYRGKKECANEFWLIKNDERNKHISYEIDPKNNDLREITSKQDSVLSRKLIKYLCSLAAAIPINHIFSTMGASPRSVNQVSISNDEKIEELVRSLGNHD